jgi:hypothetical protein
MRFEVSTAVYINIAFFWNLTMCRLMGGYQHMGGTCYHHLRVEEYPEDRNSKFLPHVLAFTYQTMLHHPKRPYVA